MKPVNLAAQLAAAETEITCLKMVLAQVREDRDELRQQRDGLRQERDAWRRVAEKLNDCALREADEL
jgi:FtsZ-binding cell division protein ZapB